MINLKNIFTFYLRYFTMINTYKTDTLVKEKNGTI